MQTSIEQLTDQYPHRYGFRVLVFDRFTVGAVHREWNISREELQDIKHPHLPSRYHLSKNLQREIPTQRIIIETITVTSRGISRIPIWCV